jgi:O-antigen ligase
VKRGYWLFLFPLAVMAFVAPAIAYFNVVFTTTTRWAAATALVVAVLVAGRVAAIFRNPVGLTALAYLAWCVLTSLWSEVPQLTLMKSAALGLVTVGMLASGQQWVARFGWERTLHYLFPILVLALFAAAFGQDAIEFTSDDLPLYEGLAGNPNMLGSLMNMAMSLLLWQCYRCRRDRRRLLVWLVMLAIVTGALLLSISRSSIIAASITVTAFLLAVGVKRNALVYGLAAIAAAGVLTAIPGVLDNLEQRYVRKSASDPEGEIFGSRQEVWEESYELALQGGFIGGGFGVTIGDEDFEPGLTAVGYGREKGNSQLAIMEETGIVGLSLYLVFLFALFRAAVVPVKRSVDRDMRVMGALVLGALAGATVQSLFEAWWVAPGSPEAAYFWALCGVASGLTIEVRKQVKSAKQAVLRDAAARAWQDRSARGGGR